MTGLDMLVKAAHKVEAGQLNREFSLRNDPETEEITSGLDFVDLEEHAEEDGTSSAPSQGEQSNTRYYYYILLKCQQNIFSLPNNSSLLKPTEGYTSLLKPTQAYLKFFI